jgi:hypothetical protein
MLTSRSTDFCAGHDAKSLRKNRYVRKSRFELKSDVLRPATCEKAVQVARMSSPQSSGRAARLAFVNAACLKQVLQQIRDLRGAREAAGPALPSDLGVAFATWISQ